MAPQTRSTTRSSMGRSTRNSIYGRSPLPPTSPRKCSTGASPVKSLVRTAPADEKQVESKAIPHVGDASPWLGCRDTNGIFTTIAPSETGEGIHLRWHYPEDPRGADEDRGVEMKMAVDNERGATPSAVDGSSNAPRRLPFPQTPMAHEPYDAGSVIRTPVKKAKPLQRSPPRIGDKGIRCLYEKDGVLRDFNGGARIILRHTIGSTANLSREQVERLEKEREDKIVRVQLMRLLAEKRRIEEQERVSDSGYEDEMDTDVSSLPGSLQRDGTNDTVLVSRNDLSNAASPDPQEESENAPIVLRGPNGELLDCHGRQMLGREGTVLIDPAYEVPGRALIGKVVPTPAKDEGHFSPQSKADGMHRPRFGPEGTELID